MVRLNWLKEAKNDLKDIFRFISKDSKKYAAFQVEKIRARTQVLKNHPTIGKIVEELQNPKVRELIEGNYRIVYRIVNSNRIDILLVHHSARDLKIRMKE